MTGNGSAEMARIEKVVFLQSAELFAECKAEEILRIAAIARERRFGPGERIYSADDLADRLYCVVQGMVRVQGPEGAAARAVGPLGAFGDVELLSGRLRAGEATSEAETLVLTFDAEDFFDLLAGNIEIVKALFRRLLQVEDPSSTVGA